MKRTGTLCLALGLLLLLAGTLLAQLDPRKEAMLPPPGPKLESCNDSVCVQVDVTTGKYNIGSRDGRSLLYAYPSPPSTSQLVFKVDGVLYSNGSPTLATTISPTVAPHLVGLTIECTYTPVADLEIIQRVTPIWRSGIVGGVWDSTGTILIQYFINNLSSTATHQVGMMLEFDTMVNRNDAAPLATRFGYACVEQCYDSATGVPDFWQAYESFPPTSTTMIGEGTLTGDDATTPDRFAVGQWGTYYSTSWDHSCAGAPYGDSATLLWWDPRTVGPGEMMYVGTYYGLAFTNRLSSLIYLSLSGPTVLRTEECSFRPDPFDLNLLIGDATGSGVDSLTVVLAVPEGLDIVTGEAVENIPMITDRCGTRGSTSWQLRANGTVVDATVCITALVTPDFVDSVYTVQQCISIPPMFGNVTAARVDPPVGVYTACADQGFHIQIQPASGGRLSISDFDLTLNGTVLHRDAPGLTLGTDGLITYVPPTNWTSGQTVNFSLDEVYNGPGCRLVAPVTGNFIVDLEPPMIVNTVPTDGVILGDPNTLVAADVSDLVSGLNPDSLSLSVYGHTYRPGDAGLSWDPTSGHLEFDPTAAGVTYIEGDTIRCEVLAQDRTTLCDVHHSSASWWFMVQIVNFEIQDGVGNRGDTVLVPVTVEDITRVGIVHLAMTFQTDFNVARIVGIQSDMGYVAQWGLASIPATLNPGLGTSTVDFSGPAGLISDSTGVLMYLQVYVPPTAPEGGYSMMVPSVYAFNHGNVRSEGQGGLFLVNWGRTVWSVDLTLSDAENPLHNAVLTLGVNPSATDGFDAGLDRLWVPQPENLNAYFPLTDPAYPYVTELQRDIRYSETLPITWRVVADSVGGTVSWNSDVLPAGRFTLNGVEMLSTDSYTFAPGEEIVIVYDRPAVVRTDLVLHSGWNLVSTDVLPAASPDVHLAFPQAVGPVYWYGGPTVGYIPQANVEPGKGYWVLVDDEIDQRTAGMPITSYSMPLHRGWNMIGCYYGPDIPLNGSLLDNPAALSQAWEWNPLTRAYSTATTISRGKGYWILITTPTRISVP